VNHEMEQQHVSASSSVAARHDEVIEPGQLSRSSLLRKAEPAIASGLIQREARDANGVAEGAEQAVAVASSSNGSPLPDTLMRKFEGTLGADLSGVRVHTGDASAQAASAVGAKAYTMGNDIHFGAGHYDPGSTSGQHLLAHEVAHTVQQSGRVRRMQFKLEVSSPTDCLEHEADRAADAMVGGVKTGSWAPDLPHFAHSESVALEGSLSASPLVVRRQPAVGNAAAAAPSADASRIATLAARAEAMLAYAGRGGNGLRTHQPRLRNIALRNLAALADGLTRSGASGTLSATAQRHLRLAEHLLEHRTV
jgi:hypothetical protein